MSGEEELPDGVQIFAADRSLQKKLGGAKLDQLLSKSVLEQAEKAITNSSDGFYEECIIECGDLVASATQLKATGVTPSTALAKIAEIAFSLKSKAGIAGYGLVSTLADSLNLIAESHGTDPTDPSTISIVDWHVGSIKKMLTAKVKGDGGEIGKAIITELQKVRPAQQ